MDYIKVYLDNMHIVTDSNFATAADLGNDLQNRIYTSVQTGSFSNFVDAAAVIILPYMFFS
jgi:hypothetical protein